MKKILLILLFIPLIQNCTNKYQRYSIINGGYSDKKLKEDVYLIKYKSYRLTDYKKTTDLALLRASEIAIKNNKSHFEANPIKEESRYSINNYTGQRRDNEREIQIAANLNPKNKNSEITFNSYAICNLFSNEKTGYTEEDFPNQLDCKKEIGKSIINKTTKKLDNYYKIFPEILRGNYIAK